MKRLLGTVCAALALMAIVGGPIMALSPDITPGGGATAAQIADIGANTTHRSSDGTDHTYIDQDLATTASPNFTGLTVGEDTDASVILGRVRIDANGGDVATFSHYDRPSAADFALKQDSNGLTYINARCTKTVGFSIGNVTKMTLDADGTLIFADSATAPPINVTERSAAPSSPGSGDVYMDDGTNTGSGGPGLRRYTGSAWEDVSAGSIGGTMTIVFDGGGSELADNSQAIVNIPHGWTIVDVTMLADQSGSAVVDLWVDTYANYPPTDADSITASAVPTITTAVKSQDTTLTGWTPGLTAGSTLIANVDSCTTITHLTISCKLQRVD